MVKGKVRIDANNDLSKVEILENQSSEDDNSSKVRVQVTFKNGETKADNFKLIKEKSACEATAASLHHRPCGSFLSRTWIRVKAKVAALPLGGRQTI